jgi:hypothetical protein
MAPAMFRRSFPRLDEFASHVDPGFSSSLWRRLADPALVRPEPRRVAA